VALHNFALLMICNHIIERLSALHKPTQNIGRKHRL
jgi:hypothetical protein